MENFSKLMENFSKLVENFSKLMENFSKQTWFPNLSVEARRGKTKKIATTKRVAIFYFFC